MIRIVKLTLQAEKVADFLANFEQQKAHIRAFDGIKHLELLNDKNNPNIYFTYSKWESEQHLENYRNSELFKGIWAVTKPMFAAKAEAWSVESIAQL
ncbi:MAG: antibiotic biosynthesis monooxygenase [Vicingaceae bacterium]|nr:antibiotic biosynthesis monooxygenase [Vicingaceae bacterium]